MKKKKVKVKLNAIIKWKQWLHKPILTKIAVQLYRL